VVAVEIYDVLKDSQPCHLERSAEGLDNRPALPWEKEQ